MILPAREVTLEKDRLDEIINRLRGQAIHQDLPPTTVRDLVQRIKDQGVFPGIENLTPLIYPRMDTLFDYLPPDTVIIAENPAELAQAADKSAGQAQVNYDKALSDQRICVRPEALFLSWAEIESGLTERQAISLTPLALTGQAQRLTVEATMTDNGDLAQTMDQARKGEQPAQPLVQWIGDQQAAGRTLVMVCETARQVDRLAAILAPYQVKALVKEPFPLSGRPKGVFICQGTADRRLCMAGGPAERGHGNRNFRSANQTFHPPCQTRAHRSAHLFRSQAG